ncbi:hypothetical protein BZA05DRAFT_386145 [Tricharina praecox]|uniref:uncharacterized protein n=1 Tax=Tricharina praecox TaxID=43433 RepID=UPI00221E5E87|nr:uncharacterized protein BZA05DRAFT_386145 [Tricharina praecox]KAI5858156.1 hypothetical protein BZA05DRAFT_386145 [Tricharina praecox]
MTTAATLSLHDSNTLSLLFDPESSPSSTTGTISPSLPPDPHYPSAVLPLLQTLERQAISLAEASPAEALTILSSLITTYPQYASAYNNRAQLLRILSHSSTEITADLRTAITLARPARSIDAVSPLQAKVLSNSYTQLGAVLLSEGREEEAGEVFQAGARYGGEVAKMMAVKFNPVARLCGAIVKEAMRKEMAG